MSELSELHGHTIAEARDWLELQRGYFGEVPSEFQPVIALVDTADQQAARIAELEAALQKIAALAHQPHLATSNLYDIQEYLRALGYDGEPG